MVHTMADPELTIKCKRALPRSHQENTIENEGQQDFARFHHGLSVKFDDHTLEMSLVIPPGSTRRSFLREAGAGRAILAIPSVKKIYMIRNDK